MATALQDAPSRTDRSRCEDRSHGRGPSSSQPASPASPWRSWSAPTARRLGRSPGSSSWARRPRWWSWRSAGPRPAGAAARPCSRGCSRSPSPSASRPTGRRAGLYPSRWPAALLGVAGVVLVVGGTAVATRARRWWRRAGAGLAVVVAVAVVAFVVGPAVAATNVPRPAVGATPTSVGLAYEDVTLRTGDGVDLAAWYVPSSNRAAVVLLHGAGSTRSNVLDEAAVLAGAGFGVLVVDARGHGESAGARWTSGGTATPTSLPRPRTWRRGPTSTPSASAPSGCRWGARRPSAPAPPTSGSAPWWPRAPPAGPPPTTLGCPTGTASGAPSRSSSRGSGTGSPASSPARPSPRRSALGSGRLVRHALPARHCRCPGRRRSRRR